MKVLPVLLEVVGDARLRQPQWARPQTSLGQGPGKAPGNISARKARAEGPVHLTAMRRSPSELMNRAVGAHGLRVPMPGPLAQAGMNRAFGP